MTIVVFTGIWGAGKTTAIRQFCTDLLQEGRESVTAIGPATLTCGLGFLRETDDAATFQQRCERIVAFAQEQSETARFSLRESHLSSLWQPAWAIDMLHFNTNLYDVPVAESWVDRMNRSLSDLGARVIHLRVADPAAQEYVQAGIARGPRWQAFLSRQAARTGTPVESMLLRKQEELEAELWRSGLPVEVREDQSRPLAESRP